MQVDPRAPLIIGPDFVEMMNALNTCVLVHDALTKNILWANPAACALLEFSLDEILPLKANDMSSSAQQYDRVVGRAWLQEAVEKGSSRMEWHYRSRSGRVIPTDAIAVRVELAQGPAVMVQFRDIEREQRIEQALRRTTSYVDALARHTSTMAVMLDATGNVQFATDSALEYLGVQQDEPLAALASYARLRQEGRPAQWEEILGRAAPVASVQLEVPRPGQEPTWLEGSLERLQQDDHDQEDGAVLLMILHDVSERIQGEVRRDRELHHENYLARYNAMGDMAMAIAHELGQPLAAARNFLSGALSGSGDQLVYGVESAARQIERAASIVTALRGFVGHLEHVEQVVDLNAIVEDSLHFIRLRARPAWVEVDVQLAPEPIMVRCERVLTGQVVLNLCSNAIEEMQQCPPATRRIFVGTSRRHAHGDAMEGVFTVDDQGRGLPDDPFAESFTSKERGSGIGLALSHRIITRQHGTIWAEDRPGGGSRFRFALPLAQEGNA